MFWDSLLFAFIGLTISVSVMSVGPLVAFGFLLLPPLIAYQFARNTAQFLWLSSVIGGMAAVAGFAVAYAQDLPVGPTDLALLGILYVVTFLGRKGVELYRERRMRAATGA